MVGGNVSQLKVDCASRFPPTIVGDPLSNQDEYEIKFPSLPAVTVGQQKLSSLRFEMCMIVPGQLRGRGRNTNLA
jgi:hypothetical protein